MRLSPCGSCQRLVRASDPCPFCGASAAPTVSAPAVASLLLAAPLWVSGCTEAKAPNPPPEPAYGAVEVVDPPPPKPGGNTAAPRLPEKADPPPAGEPQGEIYGTPEMMDPEPEPKVEAEPAPK